MEAVKGVGALLKSRVVSDSAKIDDILLSYLSVNPTQVNVVQPLSFALLSVQSTLTNQPLYALHR
jgi:hypothetical protein